MPKISNGNYLLNEVLDAYRAVGENTWELLPVEGSAVTKTKATYHNIRMLNDRRRNEELQQYYKIAEDWSYEVGPAENLERVTATLGLHLIIPQREARLAVRLYQWFQHKPEALQHFNATKTEVEEATVATAKRIQKEVSNYQRELQELGAFLDV